MCCLNTIVLMAAHSLAHILLSKVKTRWHELACCVDAYVVRITKKRQLALLMIQFQSLIHCLLILCNQLAIQVQHKITTLRKHSVAITNINLDKLPRQMFYA